MDAAEREGTLRTPQYWLAELDQYDNPTLTDGSHESAEDANHAAYLIQRMGLGNPNRRFAVARVELSECVPSGKDAGEEALDLCKKAVDFAKRNKESKHGRG